MTERTAVLATPPAVRGTTFLQRVRAEALPTRFSWYARDWVALLAVPAIFIGGWLVMAATEDRATIAISDTIVRIMLFTALVVANRSLLARHWRRFWAAPWRSAGVVVAGLIVVQVIVSVVKAALRPFVDHGVADGQGSEQPLAIGILFFASLNPVVTALIEDFTFRHTLLLKFPIWNRYTLAASLTVLNALVFGAIHIGNFEGQWLLTLSYAGAGLLMNLVYLWTRNIWHVLLMHGLNNFILGGPVTVLLAHMLGAVMG